MNPKAALKSQYHAALAMLKETIDLCPEGLWIAGEPPRSYWRIAYHALYYCHWYLQSHSEDFKQWELSRKDAASLWSPPADDLTYAKAELLDYWHICNEAVDAAIEAMDLDADSSGFDWYKMSKFEHQLVNLRHIQQHVGQLAERLATEAIETTWVK